MHSPSDREQQELHSRLPHLLPTSFTTVRLSPLSLLQMLLHARQGIPLEVMGLMLGSVHPVAPASASSLASPGASFQAACDYAFAVHSVFRLPVEGTETRVNAGAEANEYMVNFIQRAEEAFSPSPCTDPGEDEGLGLCVVGWYHSHPGYRCWLSGVDVETQKLHQRGQDPFLAIVVDPTRTLATGEVDIGAFRCYPENGHDRQSVQKTRHEQAGVPVEKAHDFGVHWREYYKLNVDLLCSSLDALLIERLSEAAWFAPLLRGPHDQTAATRRAYRTSQIFNVARKARQSEASFVPALPKPCPSLAVHDPHTGPSPVSSSSSPHTLRPPQEDPASSSASRAGRIEESLLSRPGAQERLASLAAEEEQTERMQQHALALLQSRLEKKYVARLAQCGEPGAEEEDEDGLDAVLREAHQVACDQRRSVISATVADTIFGPEAESRTWLAIKRRLREERERRSCPRPCRPGSARL